MKCNLFLSLLLIPFISSLAFGQLKYVIYDFEGLNIGQSSLPGEAYRAFDMFHRIAVNPLDQSDMLGERMLQLDIK